MFHSDRMTMERAEHAKRVSFASVTWDLKCLHRRSYYRVAQKSKPQSSITIKSY